MPPIVTDWAQKILDDGGFTPPSAGAKGYFNEPLDVTHYQGPNIISDIPDFMRDYGQTMATLTRIKEGRFNMARMITDFSSQNGLVVDDVTHTWYLDYAPIPRMYLKVKANQGYTAGSTAAKNTFVVDSLQDVKKLQKGDLIAVMCTVVPPSRDANSELLDYVSSGGTYQLKNLETKPLPSVHRIEDVNYSTGQITTAANIGGDLQTTARQGVGFTVVASSTANPGANEIRQEDAFFIKMTRPMVEGMDDSTVWSRSITRDFNHCQYILRKWGVTDIQENIKRRGQPQGQYAKNRMEAIEQYFEELEYYLLFGMRKEEWDASGRWKGHMGGFLESIALSHYEALQEPDYTSATKDGDFTIKKMNKKLENKFYMGDNTKILLCGQNVHTAYSWMFNKMTQNIPTIVDQWSVKGRLFETSSAGRMIIVPSDTMSLNGLSNMGILFDPSTFILGHLNNMPTQIVDPLPSTNIHEKSGEIFGVLTTKKVNFDANWVFVLQPNVEA